MKLDIRPLSLLSKDRVRVLTGLKSYQLDLMMVRQYDEPFIFEGEGLKMLIERVRLKDLRIMKRGRFFHIKPPLFADGIGPRGWNRAILDMIGREDQWRQNSSRH